MLDFNASSKNKTTSPQIIIQIEHLYVHRKADCVLENINCTIVAQSMVGIIGPNGAGKSTLLNAIVGIQPTTSGTLFIHQPTPFSIAYVPQRASVDWDFPITVQEVVMMGRYPFIPFYKSPSKEDKEIVHNSLCLVGMENLSTKPIGQLSGGQQQRVFFARALAQQPSVYLLDEPFAGIDATTESDLLTILKKEKLSGKTVVMVHHDLSSVQEYFDTILVLNKTVLYQGTPENLDQNNALLCAYGRKIIYKNL